MISLTDSSKPLVCLEGLQQGNRFFTSNTQGSDPTKSDEGETWYKVLAYCDTAKEAQSVIYGDGYNPLDQYIEDQRKFLGENPRMEAMLRGIHAKSEFERIVSTDTQTLIDGHQAIEASK